ncbi:MAG: SMP-30/gluconolactonase/LRE family protein [Elusimicrobiota bacterium]
MKSLKVLFILLTACSPVWAAIGIKLTSNEWNVAQADGSGAGTWTSPAFTVQNIGTEPSKLLIRASNTQNWSLAAAPGMNIFAMQFGDGNTWNALSTAESVLVSSLSASSQYNFLLRYQSPSDLTDKTLSLTQTSTVTVSIVSTALQPPVTSYVFLSKYGALGSGNGQFNWPYNIAFDASGNIYVTETNTGSETVWNCRVQKFDSNFNFITKWGTLGSGDGQFNYPRGIEIDSQNNVYVMDMFNNRIQKFTSDGVFIKKWGSLGSGDGQLNQPDGMCIDHENNIYVAEYYGHRISKFSPDGVFLAKYGTGTEGAGDGQFHHPTSVAVDNIGNIYVTDLNYRVQKLGPDGTYITKWGSWGLGNGQFDSPSDIYVDRSGNILVADSRNYTGQNRVQIFTPDGAYIGQVGNGYGTGDGQFKCVIGLCLDKNGNLYTVDMVGNRIQIFTPQ